MLLRVAAKLKSFKDEVHNFWKVKKKMNDEILTAKNVTFENDSFVKASSKAKRLFKILINKLLFEIA